MQFFKRHIIVKQLGVLTLCVAQLAHAHLMVAQHGTLNIVDDGAFMVLSLPISAFAGIDDDNDGKVSMVEFNRHRSVIVESVTQNVTLSDSHGEVHLQDIMLSPVASNDMAVEPLSQLVILGRFPLNEPFSALRFHVGLYGGLTTEQSLKITAMRKSDHQKDLFELTPIATTALLFPGDY